MFNLMKKDFFANVTVICQELNLLWAMVGETRPCFHATCDARIVRISRIGRKLHLLALPFISGVTSCWSRVEREGREETRWEL